jgi:hypothetical protein
VLSTPAFADYSNYEVRPNANSSPTYLYSSNDGTRAVDSNGYSYTKRGNTVYSNNGNFYNKCGNMIYSSDGKQYMQTGNLIQKSNNNYSNSDDAITFNSSKRRQITYNTPIYIIEMPTQPFVPPSPKPLYPIKLPY